MTAIEWADRTWNPVRGCSIVSKGCTNCYAMKMAHRFSGPGKPYEGLTKLHAGGPVWTGDVRVIWSKITEPLSWRKPCRVFVNSMSDLFHEDVALGAIDCIFAVMTLCPRHTFQVLTKRPGRMLEYLSDPKVLWRWAEWTQRMAAEGIIHRDRHFPFRCPGLKRQRHIWLGVSVEDQATADERVPLLLETPAAVRFISYEPALGKVDFEHINCEYSEGCGDMDPLNGTLFGGVPGRPDRVGMVGFKGIDWVIVGGESGPRARAFDIQWARDVVAQCRDAGVPVFVKQLGAQPGYHSDLLPGHKALHLNHRKGADMFEWPDDLRVRQFPERSPVIKA